MLKLAKLPDKTTTRIAFSASVKLNETLRAYVALYKNTYDADATIPELIPLMLETFLKSDPAFSKAQREGSLNSTIEKESHNEKQSTRSQTRRSETSAPISVPHQSQSQV